MGRHLDRYKEGQKEAGKEKAVKPFVLKNDKAFKEMVEKVGVLELALNDLIKKIATLEVKTETVEE